MMSIESIRALADEIAVEAAREERRPYVPWDAEEIEGYPPFPFPNIGSYEPEGWELVDTLFVDKTGLGYESEPALTIRGLQAALLERVDQSLGYAIIEEGQFQLVLGAFRRVNN